jgi:hypothetical protein
MKPIAISAIAVLVVAAGIATLMSDDSVSIPAGAPVVSHIGEMSLHRAAHQATVLESGEVLITGGCAGDGCTPFHPSAEVYDPADQSFRSAAPMSLPRASHTATLLQDGRVLIAGGCSAEGATARAEIYDATADRWMRAGDMAEPRCSHVAVPLGDGRVFVMGGGGGRLGELSSAEVFDPATSSFSSLGRMRNNYYLATPLRDGRILLTGGQSDRGEIIASAAIFDPGSGQFERTGQMATGRVKHAAAPLSDARVLVIGGSDHRGFGGRFNSTEIYDPESGRFSPGPELRYGRHKIRDAVAVLPSGAIVVVGGAIRPELYDPADRIFLPVRGELSGPQMFATASVLKSGEVLVLGGYDERTRPSASAWVISLAR